MCEILAVILQLHARYEKLILKEPKNRSRQHKQDSWKKYRTLVIVTKGFHRVIVSFDDLERIVAHKFREEPMAETPEVVFAGDDSELFGRLVNYIESDVQEVEWWPQREVVLDDDAQREITELLKELESDDVDDDAVKTC